MRRLHQRTRWQLLDHLPLRCQVRHVLLHPSLSLVLSTVTALVDVLGLMVYPSASRHASSMPRDPVLGSTMVPESGLLGLLDLDRVNKKRIGLILTLTKP